MCLCVCVCVYMHVCVAVTIFKDLCKRPIFQVPGDLNTSGVILKPWLYDLLPSDITNLIGLSLSQALLFTWVFNPVFLFFIWIDVVSISYCFQFVWLVKQIMLIVCYLNITVRCIVSHCSMVLWKWTVWLLDLNLCYISNLVVGLARNYIKLKETLHRIGKYIYLMIVINITVNSDDLIIDIVLKNINDVLR